MGVVRGDGGMLCVPTHVNIEKKNYLPPPQGILIILKDWIILENK